MMEHSPDVPGAFPLHSWRIPSAFACLFLGAEKRDPASQDSRNTLSGKQFAIAAVRKFENLLLQGAFYAGTARGSANRQYYKGSGESADGK